MLQKKIKLSFKVCCYLQSQKVWASIIQNHVMFQKSCRLNGIVNRSNISKKIFYVDFGRDFPCSKSIFLSKAPTARYKKVWNNFCSIVFLFASAQKGSKNVSQILKILFHKLEIVIFFELRGVICYVKHL